MQHIIILKRIFLKRLFLVSFLVAFTQLALAQSLSFVYGPTCALSGNEYHYVVNGNSQDYYYWSINGGTITGTQYGQGAYHTTVVWNSTGFHSISVSSSNGEY